MYLPRRFHVYTANMENQTLVGDAGDFFVLSGATVPFVVIEVEVFQRGSTTLLADTLLFHRGTGASGGGALTEYKFMTSCPDADVAAVSLPTVDVGSDDWQLRRGLNLLQGGVHLALPELWIPVASSTQFGIAKGSSVAHTGVGVNVTWAEFTGLT